MKRILVIDMMTFKCGDASAKNLLNLPAFSRLRVFFFALPIVL